MSYAIKKFESVSRFLLFFKYIFRSQSTEKNLKCLEKFKRENLAYLPCTDIKVLII